MAPVIPIVAGVGAALAGGSSAAIAGATALGAAGAFLGSGGDDAPPPITDAPNPVANKLQPINFASIFDELTRDRLDISRNLDGQLELRFANDRNTIDLNAPVSAGSLNSRLPAIRPVNQRAADVVALSGAMSRLGNVIEQTENTNPMLIAQNRELIDSYRTASTQALDRGFDFRQYAIDQRLSKMGLDNSSTAFGVQVALAREKSNAYAQNELQTAQLAQGLKQQSIANLHQRGELLGQQAGIELNRFAAENQANVEQQRIEQQQAFAQKQLDLQQNQQRIDTELANKAMVDSRRQKMAELGLNAFNQGNNQAIGAQSVDNQAIANANQAQYQEYGLRSDPLREAIGAGVSSFVGNAGTRLAGNMFGNPFGVSTDNWLNPDSTTPIAGTSNWSSNSRTLTGSRAGGMRWS